VKITTERLEITPFTAEAVDAMLGGDAARLEALTGARFRRPLTPPPLTEEVLSMVRDRLRAHPAQEGWWTWLAILREGRQCVGSLGFGGPPDAEGTIMIGYATYPGFERRGLATEAVTALVGWALAQPLVHRVCASIPPGNTGALGVAQRVGMRQIGTIWEEDVDEVLLYAIDR
jgi:[ribosomal protein S5]-alanine N-acetyltransferase